HVIIIGTPPASDGRLDEALKILGDLANVTLQLRREIMAVRDALATYVADQKAFNASMSTELDGISSDVDALAGKIADLENKISDLSDDEKAALAEVKADSQALLDRMKAVNDKTPPAAPPATPAAA